MCNYYTYLVFDMLNTGCSGTGGRAVRVQRVLVISAGAVRGRAGVPQHVSSTDLITSNIMMLM